MKILNCCDGKYNSFDVHFTSLCDNKCAHCVDQCYEGLHIAKPDVKKIADTIVSNSEGVDDVLFLGGEPCLFLDELIECTKAIKSQYDRQEFYRSLPYKEKIRINLNIVKPYLYKKEDLIACLKHYDAMGFNSIKLSEIQHGKEYFVSFEDIFGIKLKSPFAHGCQTYLDLDKMGIIKGFKTPLLLKRSCFLCEETLKASPSDVFKVLQKCFVKPKNKYGVVYENGLLSKGWI